MENKKNPLLEQSLTYGLYFGLIMIALSLIYWMLNIMPTSFSTNIILFLVNLVFYFGFLYYFTRMYREQSLGGFISYSQAFLFALLVVVFSSLLTGLYNYVFNAFIDPDYMERVMKVSMESTESWMRERGLGQERIDQTMARFESRGIPTPFKSAMQSLIGGTVFGLVVSLITSAIARKQEQVY